MGQSLLPLFPLQTVLLPGAPLTLHIFEDRYKEMIGEVLRAKAEFGVVLASEKGIVNMGCTASIDQVLKMYPDGRLDILAIGRRRFEILTIDDDKAYLQGSVEFFDDDEFEPAAPDAQRKALDGYTELQGLDDSDELVEPRLNDPQLSFQLGRALPDLDQRQMLLATRSEAARMKQLADFFPEYAARQRQIRQVKEVARKNGHARWPSSLGT